MVGMALKDSGLPVTVWEAWSARDGGRYHKGECAKKWESFHGSTKPVTESSIFQLAYSHGWSGPAGHALDWGDELSAGPGAQTGGNFHGVHQRHADHPHIKIGGGLHILGVQGQMMDAARGGMDSLDRAGWIHSLSPFASSWLHFVAAVNHCCHQPLLPSTTTSALPQGSTRNAFTTLRS